MESAEPAWTGPGEPVTDDRLEEVQVLVLARHEGEAVLIPVCGIRVKVLRLSRGRVSLGFTAPTGVNIVREELAHGNEMVRLDAEGGRTRGDAAAARDGRGPARAAAATGAAGS